MASSTPNKKQADASQNFLEIEEIREGVVLLKNGEMRAVLMASGINFALRSEEEQEALLYGYQDFLNSLDFPVQFIIHSRRLDIKNYLELLKNREEQEQNELLRLQIAEYREFVRNFVAVSNVMTKRFFVVIPFGIKGAKENLVSTFRNTIRPPKVQKIPSEKFLDYKHQLMQRAEYIASGLSRFEIKTRLLGTEELIELYWSLYNPEEGDRPYLPEEIQGATMGNPYGYSS